MYDIKFNCAFIKEKKNRVLLYQDIAFIVFIHGQ